MQRNPTWAEYCQYNADLTTYGSSITISRNWLKMALICVIIAPIGTAWMSIFLPKIKDIKWRYGQ